MDRNEVLMTLSCLKAAFPNAYKGMSKADSEAMVNLWCRLFADDSYVSVAKAVDSLIVTREGGWTPAIGEIKAEMAKLTVPDLPSEEEAWQMVRKAVRNSYYHSQREYDRLPPQVQRAVGSPLNLKEWSCFSDESMERLAYAFKKSYRETKDEEIRAFKLPESVRSVAAGVRIGIGDGS